MSEIIKVGLAELKIGTQGEVMISQALGSCVALAIYDPYKGVGGLAHIMLPFSRKKRRRDTLPARFADEAVERLVRGLEGKGAKRGRMLAKLAGGASMFSFGNEKKEAGEGSSENTRSNLQKGTKDNLKLTDIGSRNVITVREILEKEGIELVAEDVGGRRARTVEFDTSSGRLKVKSVRVDSKGEVIKEEREL